MLSTLHLALDGPGLARFSARFRRSALRGSPPTLDDLFLKLADKSAFPPHYRAAVQWQAPRRPGAAPDLYRRN
ncbi:MAG: hypothetical protein IPL99_24015 [Candidatus Competibacteraceae bacterium]|nr:hypothetical protein [Candidatus Competibacteraceae bacterium]